MSDICPRDAPIEFVSFSKISSSPLRAVLFLFFTATSSTSVGILAALLGFLCLRSIYASSGDLVSNAQAAKLGALGGVTLTPLNAAWFLINQLMLEKLCAASAMARAGWLRHVTSGVNERKASSPDLNSEQDKADESYRAFLEDTNLGWMIFCPFGIFNLPFCRFSFQG